MTWEEFETGTGLQCLIDDENKYINKLYEYTIEMIRHNPDYAQTLLERILQFAREHQLKRSEATMLTILGYSAIDSGNYTQGMEQHTLANEIFEEINDTEGILRTCNGLMFTYFCLGMYNPSMECATKGLKLAEKTNNQKYLQVLLMNIAQNYIMLEQYDEAKQMMESINGLEYENSSMTQVILNQMRAELCLVQQDLSQANDSINRAIKIAKHKDYERLLLECYTTLAKLKFKNNEIDKAYELYDQILMSSEKSEYIEVRMNALIDLGKMEVSLYKYESAHSYLLEAYDITNQLMMPIPYKKTCETLIDMLKQVKNYELALYYYEEQLTFEKQLETRQSELWASKLKHEKSISEAKLFKQMYEEIFLISNIGRVLTSKLSYNILLKNMADELSNLMDVSILGMSEFDEEKGLLAFSLYDNTGDTLDEGTISYQSETSLGVYCIKNRVSILMNEVQKEYTNYIPKKQRFKVISKGIQSIIMCPLLLNEEVKGFITVQSYQQSAYTSNDLNKLNLLASYVAVAFENARLYRQMHYLASNDSLTGLFNRIEMFKRGKQLLSDVKPKDLLSVMMIDVDHFKKINDQYGHQVGDKVLIQVGEVLQSKISNDVVIGRYGGEEFLILLNGYTLDEATLYAEDLREEIANLKFVIDEQQTLKITASFGGYTFKKVSLDLDKGIFYADAALYESKKNGRNKVTFYE